MRPIISPWQSLGALALCLVLPALAAAQSPPAQAPPTEVELRQQIAQDPSAPAPYLALAQLYLAQGRTTEAERLIQNALVLTRRAMASDPNAMRPVRIGGDIQEPVKLKHVAPVYPAEARAAGISGMIIVEAVIDKQGNVVQTQVLRSIPELDQAAVDAVSQWQYTPTVLAGQPVDVIMTVTVNFTTGG